MRLTIIPSDMAVYKDNVCHSALIWEGTPECVHALQWNNDHGWIEFKEENSPYSVRKPNEEINELPEWALNALNAWEISEKESIEALALASELSNNAEPLP